MKRKFIKSEGFTIVELLAVIAITVILGTLLLANTREPSRKFDLRRGVQTLSADFRKAQALAISAQLTECGPITKVSNYGLRIREYNSTSTVYSIFADCNQNNQFDPSGSDDFIVETTILSNVFVNLTNPSSGGVNYLDIVYSPPIPDIAIDGSIFSYPDVGTFSIQLCHFRDPSLCSEIRGNSRGNVEIIK